MLCVYQRPSPPISRWCRNYHVTFTTRARTLAIMREARVSVTTRSHFPTNIRTRNILTLLVTEIVTPAFIEHCAQNDLIYIHKLAVKFSFSHLFICLWSRDFGQDISQEINTNLPAGRVLTEESKFVCEPGIDLMEGQLHLGGIQNCLEIKFVCKNSIIVALFPTEC